MNAGAPLRIVHLITRLERGGSSDCTLLQAIAAARRGHRVTVAAGPSPIESSLVSRARATAGLELVIIPELARPIRPWNDLRALRAIVRLLRERACDILHTHTSKAGALGRLATLFRRPAAVLHQPHGHLFYGYYGALGSRCIVLAERALARLADAQIALTRRGAEEHLRRGIGRPEAFHVVRSGVDLRPWRRRPARDRNACRAALGVGADRFVVGTLCRLERIKGAGDLLEAFVHLAPRRPGVDLVIAGDGPLRHRLRERTAEAGLSPRVRIDGHWRSPRRVLPALDLFVLASRNEGMGRALVEAMASGLAIVATDVGGVGEVLEEGRCGILVPPGDPEALAAAIDQVAGDPALRAALGAAARTRAVAFGAGRMGRQVIRLYREVLP
jgi:glycosyltransferase involved in cell wall biosynthesis